MSIGYISGQAKGGIDNQFLITGFSIKTFSKLNLLFALLKLAK
ncbi:hypothetical protein N0824_00868 [Microcystis sp. 0824]|nr:hypothetical protein N0824_00868 [Microcystis sp. 0824]